MVTMQVLLLTVVLILPSVENLFFRNPDYSATVDMVRVLGRLIDLGFVDWMRVSGMLLISLKGHQ